MKVWISGEVQHDITESYRLIINKIESTINEQIAQETYGEGLEKLAYIAIIKEIDNEDYPEIKKYSAKKKIAEFRLKIDHSNFKNANESEKEKMVWQSLFSAVKQLAAIGVKKFDIESFTKNFQKILENSTHSS